MEDEHYLLSLSTRRPIQLTDVEDIGKVIGSEAKADAAEQCASESKLNPDTEVGAARRSTSKW